MEWFELTGVGGIVAILAVIRMKYGRYSAHHRYLREEFMSEKWIKEKKRNHDE
ncbi:MULTISPECIES: hypothetical protein [Bacillales]|uniref:hypothetical protein n=1 Tax=Bacillales TaxID=1385 RepID=UPI000C00FCB2|nr:MULTISPECIES: hypothetical protein [Bacillaceae]MCA0992846.1 hypothetical protein [Pseudalkalibacillus hwajinpoensis]PFG14016.1 hypothetical protein ATG70_2240 [Bacillus sp. es.036]